MRPFIVYISLPAHFTLNKVQPKHFIRTGKMDFTISSDKKYHLKREYDLFSGALTPEFPFEGGYCISLSMTIIFMLYHK